EAMASAYFQFFKKNLCIKFSLGIWNVSSFWLIFCCIRIIEPSRSPSYTDSKCDNIKDNSLFERIFSNNFKLSGELLIHSESSIPSSSLSFSRDNWQSK